MSRRLRYSRLNQALNVWQSFTDVMSSAFMILSLFLFLALLKSGVVNSDISRVNTELKLVKIENKKLQDKVKEKDKEIQEKSEKIKQQEKTIKRKNEEISSLTSQPPIEITEVSNRKFPSGSAELSDGLVNFIENNLVKQIENYAQGKEGYIVQVIGHTDGQQNNRFQVSNLDNLLEEVARVNNNINISNLTPSSNADLGLMRALAVVKELEKNPRLKQLGLKFRAYSAAQLYLPSGKYAGVQRYPDPQRRRIEIRFSPPADKK